MEVEVTTSQASTQTPPARRGKERAIPRLSQLALLIVGKHATIDQILLLSNTSRELLEKVKRHLTKVYIYCSSSQLSIMFFNIMLILLFLSLCRRNRSSCWENIESITRPLSRE